MKFHDPCLSFNGQVVVLNESEIKGLEAYASLIFAAAIMRGAKVESES